MLLQHNIQNVNWIAIQLMLNVYTDCFLSDDNNSMEKCRENVNSSYHMSMQTSVFQNLLYFDLCTMPYKQCKRNAKNWNQIKKFIQYLLFLMAFDFVSNIRDAYKNYSTFNTFFS